MTETDFIESVCRRIAIVCVGASALRKQGAPGIIDKSREYFIDKILLPDLFSALTNEARFKSYLDQHTARLRASYADGGQSWGAARKALNLFFRDVVYNRYLSDFFGLPSSFPDQNRALRYLEVPLDKDVGASLNHIDKTLPKWSSIKQLSQQTSDRYQKAALAYAETLGIARVHLDLRFWRQPQLTQPPKLPI